MLGQPIPELRVKLYHATNSGKDFSTLIRFLKEGARSDIASGYGQGQGFYVWTTLKQALEHVDFQKDFNLLGFPMVLVFEEGVNPAEWDLDYEVCAKLVIAFISGHWKQFKSISDNAISFDDKGRFLIISKCQKRRWGRQIVLGFQFQSGSCGIGLARGGSEYSALDAERLSRIFNYFQEHFPKETKQFEESVFKKSAKKGIGLKYVGKKPLKLDDLMIKVDGKWIEGEEARRIARLNGVIF